MSEAYWGRMIEVVTAKQPDGSWRATAHIQSGSPTEGHATSADSVETKSHPTEEEARQAAFAAAKGQIDQQRVGTGKP